MMMRALKRLKLLPKSGVEGAQTGGGAVHAKLQQQRKVMMSRLGVSTWSPFTGRRRFPLVVMITTTTTTTDIAEATCCH